MTDILQINGYSVNTNDFIGKGGYGIVFGCFSKTLLDKQLCAKIIQSQIDDEYLQREISILQRIKQLNTQNLVKIYDVISQFNQTYIIMERCEVGDLKLLIDQYKNQSKLFTLEEIQDFLSQIIAGYKVLYDNQMIHRDLKPANVLLTYDQQNKLILKITDFSLGKVLEDMKKKYNLTKAGTPGYLAPQLCLQEEQFSSKCDIFSLGVILYQLIFLRLPFICRSKKEMIDQLLNLKKHKFQCPSLPQNQGNGSNFLQQLINKMLVFDEDQRISWEELFKLNIKGDSNIIMNSKLQLTLEYKITMYKEQQGNQLLFKEDIFNQILKFLPQIPIRKEEKIIYIIIQLLIQAQFVYTLNQSLENNLLSYFPKFDILHFELLQTSLIGFRSKILTNVYGFCTNNINIICEDFRQLLGINNLVRDLQMNQFNLPNSNQQQKLLFNFIEEFHIQTLNTFQTAENNLIQLMRNNNYHQDINKFAKLMKITENTEYNVYSKWFHYFWKKYLRSLLTLDKQFQQNQEYLKLLIMIERFQNLHNDYPIDQIFQLNSYKLLLEKNLSLEQLIQLVKQRKLV